ncbi:Uu.00g045270.m01.CDS01 [Anthostomella pinea]|uniref:Uu.00g045270.m01.CDS01 n=1 Tax=Anthostomella pinea TaxID=933095 RepID=A0AAI8YBZ8_9PEZI|nr:Uu.00g045270.m01.CDS01 [Anthostomella pinea]
MCLFPTTPKRKKAVKKCGHVKATSEQDFLNVANKAADEAIKRVLPTTPTFAAANPVRMVSRDHLGYPVDFWPPEESLPANITRGQWKEHTETSKKTLAAAQESDKKTGDAREAISAEVKEAQEAIKDADTSIKVAHTSVKDTQTAVKDTHATVKEVHDAIKDTQKAIKVTQDAIKGNHGEHLSKQGECAASVDQVRKLLEDDARRRDEAAQKQQTIQEVLNYVQYLRQADRAAAAEPRSRSSRSSSRTASMRSSESRRAEEEERRLKQQRELTENLRRLEQLNRELNWDRERERYQQAFGAPPPPPVYASPQWSSSQEFVAGGGGGFYHPDHDPRGERGRHNPLSRRPFVPNNNLGRMPPGAAFGWEPTRGHI